MPETTRTRAMLDALRAGNHDGRPLEAVVGDVLDAVADDIDALRRELRESIDQAARG